jgi:hypothetical protein
MTHKEEFKVDGEDLLKKVKDLVKQGNIRRIIIKNKDGKSLIELPLTLGVAGVAAVAVIAPALAAVGAIAALVTECSVIVEREDNATSQQAPVEGEVVEHSDQPAK